MHFINFLLVHQHFWTLSDGRGIVLFYSMVLCTTTVKKQVYRVLNFEDTVILYLLCILKNILPQKFAENRTYTHILCTRQLWSEESAQGLWWHIFQNWPPGGNVFWFNWILTYVLAYPQPMKVGSTYCSHQFSVDERIWSRVSMWPKGWTWHFGINYWFGLGSSPHFQKP